MCLFPLVNNNITGLAYKKGIKEFDCGACPECLRKRSNVWALRSVYEAKVHASNCMITLTYDNFVRDSKGNIIGETPVNPDLRVNKRDIQLFIKRLRKWYSSISSEKIKYLCCAEYGSRTHRAHYHLILFGVRFPDIHFYKKSKRGNIIYRSAKLESLWNLGICTVDSINVHSAVARYCTKYCAKSRSDKTFMLCSQKIGLEPLMADFNGISYFIDGREYPIPRVVWQEYISKKYSQFSDIMSFKYVNHNLRLKTDLMSCSVENLPYIDDSAYYESQLKRSIYRSVRDSDSVYCNYLEYWRNKGFIFERSKPDILKRIYLLDDNKFHFYKIAALNVYAKRKLVSCYPAPGSNCVSAYERWKFYNSDFRFSVLGKYLQTLSPCHFSPCPNMASDTDFPFWLKNAKNFETKLLTFTSSQCMIDLD